LEVYFAPQTAHLTAEKPEPDDAIPMPCERARGRCAALHLVGHPEYLGDHLSHACLPEENYSLAGGLAQAPASFDSNAMIRKYCELDAPHERSSAQEENGRPTGRNEEFWFQAEREFREA
jgi:hypothetical protein